MDVVEYVFNLDLQIYSFLLPIEVLTQLIIVIIIFIIRLSNLIIRSAIYESFLLTAQSPSSSTLSLMKKQITEIEREIALRKPEGSIRRDADGSVHPALDLHLLDPLSKFFMKLKSVMI